MQSRLATVDLSRLAAVRAQISGRTPAILPLNLFDEWPVVFERVAKTTSGFALSGRLEGRPLSSVTLVVNGDVVAGMINTGVRDGGRSGAAAAASWRSADRKGRSCAARSRPRRIAGPPPTDANAPGTGARKGSDRSGRR